ncbi:MAG: hypothetical protein AB8G22_16875 [Saprospiraceae bacterium]
MRFNAFSYLLILLFFAACQADTPDSTTTQQAVTTYDATAPKVTFVCEQISFDEALPESALYVNVKDSKIKLTNIPVCETISRSDYAQHNIPTEATAAAGGFYAGLGEYFYAIVNNEKIDIIAGYMDERQTDDDFHYDRMASVKDGKVTFKGMESKPDLTGLYTLGGHHNSYVLFLGMQNDTLQAQYAEIEGMLPPAEEISQYMSGFNLKPIDFDVDMNNLTFTSDLGYGKFERIPTHVLVTFEEKENPMTGEALTLNKM